MHNPIFAATHKGALGAGNAGAQLIWDDEHKPWVVKSLASRQGGVHGTRTLFNDYVATRLAEDLGLPVARVASIAIDNDFLTAFPVLRDPASGSFSRGFHFACEWLPGKTLGQYFREMPSAFHGKPDILASRIKNKDDANGILPFDSWVVNGDRAQGILNYRPNDDNLFLQSVGRRELRMVMIDHGLAFAGEWHEDPNPAHVYPQGRVGNWPSDLFGLMDFYHANAMLSLQAVEDWCDRFSSCTLGQIKDIIDEVPSAWRRDIDDSVATRFSLYLLQRTLSLKASIQVQYAVANIESVKRIGAW